MFKDDAKTFYKNEVRHLSSWHQVTAVLGGSYNIYARSRAIIHEIRSLKLGTFVEDSKHEGEVLQALARRIEG